MKKEVPTKMLLNSRCEFRLELTTWPALSLLDSSVGIALYQYRRGHGFESCSGLNIFQALISQLLKLCITPMINHVFISFPQFKYIVFHIFTCKKIRYCESLFSRKTVNTTDFSVLFGLANQMSWLHTKTST